MTSFTKRSNATRAAKKLMDAGESPSNHFEIRPAADDRFEIEWLPDEPPQAGPTQTLHPDGSVTDTGITTKQIETEIATAAQPKPSQPAPAAGPELEAMIAELERRGYRVRPPRRARRSAAAPKERRPRKEDAIDEAAAKGIMPEKPIIASPTNQHYQKRFDRLAELAAAGDWAAIEAYAVNGANTYADKLRRYRDRLVLAHANSGAAAA